MKIKLEVDKNYHSVKIFKTKRLICYHIEKFGTSIKINRNIAYSFSLPFLAKEPANPAEGP